MSFSLSIVNEQERQWKGVARGSDKPRGVFAGAASFTRGRHYSALREYIENTGQYSRLQSNKRFEIFN